MADVGHDLWQSSQICGIPAKRIGVVSPFHTGAPGRPCGRLTIRVIHPPLGNCKWQGSTIPHDGDKRAVHSAATLTRSLG